MARCTGHVWERPRIEVAPRRPLADERLRIRLLDLPPRLPAVRPERSDPPSG